MQSNLFILLVFAIFGNVVFSANSDGKDFVFNFLCYESYFNNAITTTVIVIPSYNDSICTFEYTQTSDNKVVSIQKTASYGKTNEISFDHNEVLLRAYASGGQIRDFAVQDFRIFASCTEEVKLIGRYSDPYYGENLFNIPSISNAGNKYIFSMTSVDYDQKGWITILPITQLNSIRVNIAGYINGALFSIEIAQYNTTIGQNQHYIDVNPLDKYDFNSSITISASSNFFVTYVSPFASTSNNPDASCGTSCYRDYTAFMMMPVVEKKCNDIISPSDQRMITNDFTTRLYVSPPSVPYDCNETFTMNIYDKEDNINGYQEIITSMGSSTIELTDKSEMASSTNAGQMPMYRLGSVLNHPDSLTAYGHFTHYVPSVQEWVTGKTQFFTLAKNCFVEMYTDQDGYNPDFITVDGIVLSRLNYTFIYMEYFKKKYGHFVLPVTGYGLHTIKNYGNYVIYVVCKNVNSAGDAAGYVAGFNKRKARSS